MLTKKMILFLLNHVCINSVLNMLFYNGIKVSYNSGYKCKKYGCKFECLNHPTIFKECFLNNKFM